MSQNFSLKIYMKTLTSLLFIGSLFFSNDAFACRCDFSLLKNIENNPSMAESVFVAVWKNESFLIQKHWKGVTSEKLRTTSTMPGHVTKCDLKLKDGEKYLVLSINKLKEPVVLSICQMSVNEFTQASDKIAKLNNATNLMPKNKIFKSYPMTNCKDWQPQWGDCKMDTDCVVISNPCGWPTSAANKIFSDKAFACNRLEGTAISCPSWNEIDGGQRVSKCDSGKCVNQEK